MSMHVDCCELATPFGPLHLAATDAGVVGVWFGPADEALAALARDLGDATFVEHGPRVAPVRAQVEEYLRGERQVFDLAIDWRRSKGFRLRVLHALAEVPFGVTVSYGDLARRSGSPAATRAVGGAMATNPLPVIVPCHRVVRSGGSIGGFAGARNAIDTKQWLLTHEGVLTPFAAAR
ncbi:MAG TPA: methylated-DNA--[protein]-cysteine S-methyltransferase [Acidimicrobiales bacterium]|nr:methylated-DNA--[protein]-cysteine S-methyltransferase [Acidimicrobiales bacterium]